MLQLMPNNSWFPCSATTGLSQASPDFQDPEVWKKGEWSLFWAAMTTPNLNLIFWGFEIQPG